MSSKSTPERVAQLEKLVRERILVLECPFGRAPVVLATTNVGDSPARGFYVILPPEYQSLGCLPAEQFIPALMERIGLQYYIGLLSAAQYYGAAHQRPQAFQVVLAKNRRPIRCGRIRVAFIARKCVGEIPVHSFNTPRGTVRVSSPAATAVDLVGYPQHAGGFDAVATVLSELAESIDPHELAEVAASAPIPWAQRLGYILEGLGFAEKAAPLAQYVSRHARRWTVLVPGRPQEAANGDAAWKIRVNAQLPAAP